MKSEITWSTAIPQPEIAIPVWPVATKADSRPRARAAASSSSVTDIFPIAQSEPTVCTTRASGREAGGTLSPGGAARRSRSSTPARSAADAISGSSASTVCRPASRCIPCPTASSSAPRHAAVSAPPNGATPITRTFAPSAAASPTEPTIGVSRRAYGMTSAAVRPAAAPSMTATTSRGPYCRMPCAVLANGSASWPPVKSASRSAMGLHAKGRAVAQHQPAVAQAEPGERRGRDQQVAVEIDVVGERAELRGGGDAELGLDHAAEHHPQPECARRVDHPQRLVDPAALGELDHDPVRVGRDRRDRPEVATALVDHHRQPRGELAVGAERVQVVRGERLLDELDAQREQLGRERARGLEVPALVAVDPQPGAGLRAHRLQALEV